MMLGCCVGELMQLLDREAVAYHALVGDDVGRALAAVEQRHLAEAQAGPDRGHPLLALAAMRPDLHADRAAREHEEQLRLGALADDDLALVEDERTDDRLDQAQLSRLQPLEQIELGKREFRSQAHLRRAGEQLVLAPFERHVGVGEHAHHARRLAMLDQLAGERPERTVIGDRREHELGLASGHRLAPPDRSACAPRCRRSARA